MRGQSPLRRGASCLRSLASRLIAGGIGAVDERLPTYLLDGPPPDVPVPSDVPAALDDVLAPTLTAVEQAEQRADDEATDATWSGCAGILSRSHHGRDVSPPFG